MERSEYLERIIGFADAKNARGAAESLILEYGDVMSVLQVDEYMLGESCGSKQAAGILRLTAALCSRRITDKFKFGKGYGEDELKEYLCGLFFGATVEMVYALMLDDNGRLMGCERIGEGTVNSSEILLRRLCDAAIRKGYKKVIVAHNHPRGKAQPSSTDICATASLVGTLNSAGIELIANYVVSGFDVADCMECISHTSGIE